MSRQDCINAAIRAGASEEDAPALVDELLAEKKRLQAEGKAMNLTQELASSIMRKAEDSRRAARVARRQAAIAIVKRAQVEQFITDVQAQGYSFTDALEALLVGSNERFSGSRESVSRKRGAIKALWSGSLAKELDATGMVPLLNKDRTFGEGVMREMIEPGSTGNKDMRTCADIFSRYLEEFRQRLNDAGADIGKLDNYTPQSHDEYRVLKAGLKKWHDAIIGKIDWERTLPDSTPEQRSVFLSNVYMDITTGIPSKSEERPSGPLRPRNLANSLAKERVLHFRDAESAVAYHKEFGQGTIVTAVLNRLQGSANKLALMQTFGPNPEAMLTSLIDGEAQRLKHALADKDAKKVADLWTMRGDGKVANWYKALSGEMGTPGNLTAARIFACARGIISMAKLGGAVLSSFADIPVKAMALRHNGQNFLERWRGAFRFDLERFSSADRIEYGRGIGLYTQGMLGSIYNRFDIQDGLPGKMSRWMDTFFRLSGLEAWTEGHRSGYAFTLSGMLADAAKKNFADVNPDFAVTLRRNGLESRWPLLREMLTTVEGTDYILPEKALNLSDAQLKPFLPEHLRDKSVYDRNGQKAPDDATWQAMRQKALDRQRRQLMEDVMGFLSDETGYAILEPDAKTRALMYRGTRPGTVTGELLRTILQFKAFPFTYGQRILMESRWQRASADMTRPVTGDPWGLMQFAVASILFGYLSGAAKDITKGREPRSLDKKETWIAALLQGGGLGIMGDFMFGQADRFGGQAIASLAGPGLTELSKIMPISGQLVRGEFGNAGEDALRLVTGNLPFANLWYTRSALDYMFFYHMREWMSPGTLRRTERKMKEDFNQTYFRLGSLDLTPSHIIRKGGGFM